MNVTDHPHETDHPSDHGPMGERVSVLLGDRLCVKCGFNLHGQTIAREEHYGMLAVRCPECFTIASLQEYPTLGPWAARFGLVLAVLWAACILAMAFFTGLTFYASAEGIAGVATRPAARQIGLAYAQYREANPEPEDSGTLFTYGQLWNANSADAAFNYVDPGWLAEQDLDALAANAQGGRYELKALAVTIPLVLGTAAWGLAWSVLLLHRRLAGRLLAVSMIVVLSTALLVLSHWGSPTAWDGFGPWSTYSWGMGVPAYNIAARAYGLVPALVVEAIALAAMVPGLIWGRAVARWLVRLLLPPHLRGPLAVLWHVDGLPSPPTRGEPWVRG